MLDEGTERLRVDAFCDVAVYEHTTTEPASVAEICMLCVTISSTLCCLK